MSDPSWRSPLLFLLAGVLLGGCGDDDGGETSLFAPRCVPGQSVACACTDGRSGAQLCATDGRAYGPCQCTQPAEGEGEFLVPGCVPGRAEACT